MFRSTVCRSVLSEPFVFCFERRKAQIAWELHAGDLAEAEGGSGGHSEQHFNQVQSRGALPGITAGLLTSLRWCIKGFPLWRFGCFCPLRLLRTCAPIRYLPSFTNSWGPCVKTTSRHRSINSENILLQSLFYLSSLFDMLSYYSK